MRRIHTIGIDGFTLIELLVIIALLGAFLLGLLATIDPFEQFKKGRMPPDRTFPTIYIMH